MAVFRTAPKCPKCGEEYAGIYRKNDGSFIGDDFIKWDIESHVCEKESPPVTGSAEDFQSRVLDWLLKCFGPEIAKDIQERNDRFIEESLELAQSLGYSADRAHALVDYVFDRDKGEPFQEVGGVMVTLAALCSATGLNMTMDGEAEYARINKPEIIEKIRKKQASKPTGSALPIASSQSTTIERLAKALEEIASFEYPHSSIEKAMIIAREALASIKK